MGSLTGRVAVITGAGGGLGREYALLFAREGAKVVLNDLRSAPARDSSMRPVDQLVEEIKSTGGQAMSHLGDISEEVTSSDILSRSLETFGHVDVLINNAGNFSEDAIVSSSVDDLDALYRVHLRGQYLMTRTFAEYWQQRSGAGDRVRASVVNTTSRSALNAIEGHGLYGAIKAAIVTLTMVAAKELTPHGVRVNCVAPFARTSMTRSVKTLADKMNPPTVDGDGAAFDPFEPANLAPAVGYLATAECPLSGELLFCHGGLVQRYSSWNPEGYVEKKSMWTIPELAEEVPTIIPAPRAE